MIAVLIVSRFREVSSRARRPCVLVWIIMVQHQRSGKMEEENGDDSPQIVRCLSFLSSSTKEFSSTKKTKKVKPSDAHDKHQRLVPLGKAADKLGVTTEPAWNSPSSSSLTSSPVAARSVNLISKRPRAKTFSHPSSSSWECTTGNDIDKGKWKKEKSLTVLCTLLQKQGGRFDYSPVLSRVRNTKGLKSQEESSLPYVEGSSPVMYQRHSTLSKSPYNTSMARQNLRNAHTLPLSTSSPGSLRKQQARDFASTKFATLPRLYKQPSTKSPSKKKARHSVKREDPQGSVSEEQQHDDVCKQVTGTTEQASVKFDNSDNVPRVDCNNFESSSPKDETVCGLSVSLSVATEDICSGRDHRIQQEAKLGNLMIPSIMVRSATPSVSIADDTQGECNHGDEPPLMHQFAIRAELAEELRKLSQDVQDIVETNNSIIKDDD